jgi:hypothetical protein
MKKREMSLLLILSIAVPLAAEKKDWTAFETNSYPLVDIDNVTLNSKVEPTLTFTILAPGDKVGTTWYDYQHNGTISKQIVLDPTGCVHFFWMNGLDFQATSRHCFYNFGDPPNDSVGVQIDPGSISRSGYITGDIFSDGRAVPVYHGKIPQWTGPLDFHSIVSVDLIPCLGAFNHVFVDSVTQPPEKAFWPHGAVDNSDFIHVASHEAAATAGDPTPMRYSRSTDQGNSFSTWVLVDDSLYTISYDVQTSRSSGKVAIAYTHGVPWDPSQINEDLYYYESTDYGTTWDFANPINVTNFSPSDTTRAYTDVSAIYDNNDSLHLAFSLRSVEGDSLFFFASYIAHWSKETGITVINSDSMIGWHSQYGAGAFRMMADRPSLGIDPTTGNLYCIFVGNPPGDTSAIGFPNAEIYATCSGNGGLNWGPAVNLTNNPSIGCTPGTCEDDDYPSIAEIVDDNLHILYINDKDAGGIPQNEGSWTLNPVMYLKIPKSNIICATGVEEGKDRIDLPKSISLAQNIPNPFGTGTKISYSLPEKSNVSLAIFDISGRLVKNLLEGEMEAGYHTLHWDGSDNKGDSISRGIYFYRLSTGNTTLTKKMVLLK